MERDQLCLHSHIDARTFQSSPAFSFNYQLYSVGLNDTPVLFLATCVGRFYWTIVNDL